MSRAAQSVFVFAIYLFINGVALMIGPTRVLAMVDDPVTDEIWVRLIGLLLFLLGFYYFNAARRELSAFFRWTVQARVMVLVFFLIVTIAGLARPMFLIFGVVDFVGAMWTWVTLRT